MSVFKRDNSNYKSNSACNYNYNYNYSTAWVTKCCSLSWPAHTRAINKSKGQAENPLGSPRQAQRQTNEMTRANFHKEPKDILTASLPCLLASLRCCQDLAVPATSLHLYFRLQLIAFHCIHLGAAAAAIVAGSSCSSLCKTHRQP